MNLYEEGLFDDDAISREHHWHELDMAEEAARNEAADLAAFEAWADELLKGVGRPALFGLWLYLDKRLKSG
jgi:hypothetical protein